MQRLYRSRTDQKISGVIGGLGQLLNVDANALRLLAVLVCFVTGIVPFLVTYIIAWAILPEEDMAVVVPDNTANEPS